jgi:death-on-curing protein
MDILLPTIDQVIALHDRTIAENGGGAGIRSRDVLESAWGTAESFGHYMGDVDAFQVAALLAVRITKGHGFVDGNKRAAYGALSLTLQLNGYVLGASTSETVEAIVKAASGDGGSGDFDEWLCEHCTKDPTYQALFDYDAAGPEVS